MNIEYLGTDYGGWVIDLDFIKDGDTIIDAGLGEDISFIEDLLRRRNVNVIGVDPTPKSHIYVESKNISSLTLLKKAIAPHGTEKINLYMNANPSHVSESYLPDHGSVDQRFHTVECISFKDMIKNYNPVLVKMDIEGAEYDVLCECIGVKQICVEFHHHCLKTKSIKDTEKMIKMLKSKNYELIHSKNGIEHSFLLKD